MGTGTYVKLPDMWRQVLLERGASAADALGGVVCQRGAHRKPKRVRSYGNADGTGASASDQSRFCQMLRSRLSATAV